MINVKILVLVITSLALPLNSEPEPDADPQGRKNMRIWQRYVTNEKQASR